MAFADELAEALDDIRGEFQLSATYRRGDNWALMPTVAKGKTAFKFVDEYGVSQRIETVDWLVPDALLSQYEPPRVGDRISEIIRGVKHVYEVCSVNGEACWAWSDPGHTQRRIHSHLVDRVPT